MPLEELDELPVAKASPEAVQRLTAMRDGTSMRALRADRDSRLMEMKETGLIRPATIVNFNPVPLKVTAPFPYSVPACNYPGLPKDRSIKLQHEGKTFQAAYLTIREPFLYPRIQAMKLDDATGEDIGDYGIRDVVPMGIVHEFWSQYNKTQDAPPMGGILIFEGDRHSLIKDGRLVPTLRVPVPRLLPNKNRAYSTKDQSTSDVLKSAFTTQMAYAGYAIRQARQFHQKPEERQNITDQMHRVWGWYALEKGWGGLQAKEEWMYESPTEQVIRCGNCGSPRQENGAFFCKDCAAPYNPFEAFMAGKPVDMQYLVALKGKELEEVKVELKRRRALEEEMFGESKPAGGKD